MKKHLFFLFILLVSQGFAFGQTAQQTYMWPIEGAKAGEGMIYTPQSYIDGELNFDNLFIAAPEGTTVVSPCDGTLAHFSVGYGKSLIYSMTFRSGESETFTEWIERLKNDPDLDQSIDKDYIHGSVTINAGGGIMVHISGLTGDLIFKTGQKIKKGDPLGQVGYSYHKVKEPSIQLAISRNSKSADPMTPFGLKTTFIAPGEIKPITSLTKEQAKEDFLIYIDILKEAFVGLYNVVTPEELEEYVNATVADIDSRDGDLTYSQFRGIMYGATVKIHDSHIWMHPTLWGEPAPQGTFAVYRPKIWISFINDTLVPSNAMKDCEHMLGRQIVSVNDIPADSIRTIMASHITTYDGKVEGYKQFVLGTWGCRNFFREPYVNDRCDLTVEFADGERVEMKGQKGDEKMIKYDYEFAMINRHPDGYATRMLNDSTAYIGLTTFSLNQVQVEEIGAFIDSVSSVPNLIIDVRNNNGGQDEVIKKLYSFVAGKPMVLKGYSKVNKKGDYDAFRYGLNYTPGMDDLFPEYESEEGKQGFYERPESDNVIGPDSLINYKGRLYVLANENSISAASYFPALIVRNHRGAIVGRETRNAYHFMNAVKFLDFRLPNSLITFTIPLIEVHFDDLVNDRVPYGRGVLPDYPVPLSLDELWFTNGDAILNYTLDLIANGEYLTGDDPFAVPEESGHRISRLAYIISGIGICALAVLVILLLTRRKSSDSRGVHAS